MSKCRRDETAPVRVAAAVTTAQSIVSFLTPKSGHSHAAAAADKDRPQPRRAAARAKCAPARATHQDIFSAAGGGSCSKLVSLHRGSVCTRGATTWWRSSRCSYPRTARDCTSRRLLAAEFKFSDSQRSELVVHGLNSPVHFSHFTCD